MARPRLEGTYYSRHRDEILAKRRAYYARPEVKERAAAYYARPEVMERRREYYKRWRAARKAAERGEAE